MPSGAAVIRYEGARGVVWRIKYRDADGRQVKETVGAERDGVTRRRAESELQARLDAAKRGWRKPAAITFAEYAERWRQEGAISRGWKPQTILVYRNVVQGYLVPYFDKRPLDAIRPREIVEYVRQALATDHARYERPLSAKFINLHLNVLHSIYKQAIVEELAHTNPVAGVQRPKVQRKRWRILEPHEVPRVAAAFTDPLARRIFLTVMLTGLRRFELLGLRWADVNLLERTLRVQVSKSEEGERSIAIPPSLAAELDAHYAATAYKADADYVFCHSEKGGRLDAEWYAEKFRAALAAAGITGYIRPFHDARHAALTNMAATGASPLAIMATAGHRSMATTRQYLHLAGIVFRDEAAALEMRMLGSQSVPDTGTKSAETQSASQIG